MDIREIEQRIRRLHDETSGLQGAVLRESDPGGYHRKIDELKQATGDYARFFFDARHGVGP